MTNYEKLKIKHKITIIILITGLISFILSFSITDTKIMSNIGSISLAVIIIDFFIFKHYKKTLKQAEIIRIGTEQAIKNNEKEKTEQNQIN